MNKDESAFPIFIKIDNVSKTEGGLNKREYFAAAALQGLCVPCIPGKENSNDTNESKYKAQMAVRLADALIEALSEKSND